MIRYIKQLEILLGCSGWNNPDTPDNVDGLEHSIQTRIPKDFVIILNKFLC